MLMLEGTKYFYALIAALMQNDPDDKLKLEDHAFIAEVKCVTHLATKRSFQITEKLFTVELNHFNDKDQRVLINSITSMDSVDEYTARIMNYLEFNSDRI